MIKAIWERIRDAFRHKDGDKTLKQQAIECYVSMKNGLIWLYHECKKRVKQ